MFEYVTFVVVVILAAVAMMVFTARAVKGRMKMSADGIGEQFSSRWSDFDAVTTSHEYAEHTLTPDGVMKSTLLKPAVVFVTGGKGKSVVDRFSDKRLAGKDSEKLFEANP